MRTKHKSYVPMLKQNRRRDYVILLDGLEFAMPKKQLKRITKLYNLGLTYREIAEKEQRDPYEVVLALLHQVKKGQEMRSFYDWRKLNA